MITVRQLAERLGIPHEGDADRVITSAAPIETAGPADLSFASGRKVFDQARASQAGCLIAPAEYQGREGQTLLRAANPRGVFASALMLLFPARAVRPGIHPSAAIP